MSLSVQADRVQGIVLGRGHTTMSSVRHAVDRRKAAPRQPCLSKDPIEGTKSQFCDDTARNWCPPILRTMPSLASLLTHVVVKPPACCLAPSRQKFQVSLSGETRCLELLGFELIISAPLPPALVHWASQPQAPSQATGASNTVSVSRVYCALLCYYVVKDGP